MTAKSFLRETDPISPRQAPRSKGLTQCTAPGVSCTDSDAILDPQPLLFYQVLSACGGLGLRRGAGVRRRGPLPVAETNPAGTAGGWGRMRESMWRRRPE